MTEGVLPNQITYGNNFRPKGYYTTFKQWPVTPMSSNQYWTPDQIVRFMINVKSGVMDPYRSHIQILVTVPQDVPVGGMQVDSSAQGFISQTVISSNNIEIERIAEYDTLACYLTDIGFSQYVCESRITEGLGYSNIPSHQPWQGKTSNLSETIFCGSTSSGPQWFGQANSQNLLMPVTMPLVSGRGNSGPIYPFPQSELNIEQNMNVTQVAGQVSTPLSGTNLILNATGKLNNQIVKTVGRLNAVRAQYASNLLSPNFPDIGNSLIHTSPQILNQTFTFDSMWMNNTQSGFNPKNPYQIMVPNQITYTNCNPNNATQNIVTTPNSCYLYGFQRPVSGQFSRGTNQAILSPTILQCQMQDGLILPSKVPVTTQLFRIPLISAICGILIPPDQFLLIPMEALYNLLLQVTLSRFAMFTTGYCDVHEIDSYGMSFMQQRKWIISEIYWNLHLYTFTDSDVNKQIQASLVKSIPISTTTYTLASQFQLPNGQVVRNTWPVGTQSQSLCQVICLFLSNQYNTYTFCRKQFRLSNNISSMQIKFGTEFFPSQPINGNAGNPFTLDTTGDAWPFYQQLLLSTNYLFNTNIPTPKINIKNFCINGRCYNTSNKSTYMDPNLNLTSTSYVYGQNTINTDTALGMSNFHQNRYLGKAAFIYTWQPYGHSKNYMNGLNTQGVQNFSVIFNTTGKNYFPSDQTLLIFTRSNAIVIYTNNGIKILGK